jgi:hypothetical protein
MDADLGDKRHPKRVRRAAEVTIDAGSSSERVGASTSDRPTPAEQQEALDVIHMMKDRDPPIVPRRGQPPKPNVVACAIALYRGEVFESDAEALRLFGVPRTTDVQGLWVRGKLADFAPAGLGLPGEPTRPVYLLERGEQQEQQQEQPQQPSAAASSSAESSTESSGEESYSEEDDLRREECRHERREERWAQREYARERAEHERQQRLVRATRSLANIRGVLSDRIRVVHMFDTRHQTTLYVARFVSYISTTFFDIRVQGSHSFRPS